MKNRIRDIVISLYFLFKSMPMVLRFITIFCLAGSSFAAVVFPFTKFHVDGKEVTYREFWASGLGIEVVALGISLFISGIGLCKRKQWSKTLLVLVYVVYSIILPALHNNMQIRLDDCVVSLIWLAPLIWYLYFKKSVQDYFGV